MSAGPFLSHVPRHVISMRFISSNDPWQRAAAGETPDAPGAPGAPTPQRLLTVEQWHAERDGWPNHIPVGIWLANDFEVESLADDLPRLTVVALHFPKWVDGRAYSQARLLRARLRYGGELRATGEVLVDMLPLLARTGFDAVVLRNDQSEEAARRALDFFPGHYQGDVDQPWPLFARPPGTAGALARRRSESVVGEAA